MSSVLDHIKNTRELDVDTPVLDSESYNQIARVGIEKSTLTITNTVKSKDSNNVFYTGKVTSADLTKPELVVNGELFENTDNWAPISGAVMSVDNGNLKMVGGLTDYPTANQLISGLTIGKKYTFEAKLFYSSIGIHYAEIWNAAINAVILGGYGINRNYKQTFVATETSVNIRIHAASVQDNAVAIWEKISLRESVNDAVIDGSSVLEIGETFYNETGSPITINTRNPDDSLTSIIVPASLTYVNTGVASKELQFNVATAYGPNEHVLFRSGRIIGKHVGTSFAGLGTELILNGTFDTDTSNWLPVNNALLSIVSGALRVTAQVTDNFHARQVLTVIPYRVYWINATGTVGTTNPVIKVTDGTNTLMKRDLAAVPLTEGFYVYSSTTTLAIELWGDNTTGDAVYANFDNISVKEVTDFDSSDSGVVPFDLSDVRIKCINVVNNQLAFDSLRGKNKSLIINTSDIETTVADGIIELNSNGVMLGSIVSLNNAQDKYILKQRGYTHLIWGIDNTGNRYITALNPISKRSLILFGGSGSQHHELLHQLKIKPNITTIKALNNAQYWDTQFSQKYRFTGITTAVPEITTSYIHPVNEEKLILSNENPIWNELDAYNNISEFILISEANSDSFKALEYLGDGGNQFIDIGFSPARLIIKNITQVASWYNFDNKLGTYTWFEETTGLETETLGWLTITENGFKLNSTTNINLTANDYMVLAFADDETLGQGSNFFKPTLSSQLTVEGIQCITDGLNDNGYVVNKLLRSTAKANITVDASTFPDDVLSLVGNADGSFSYIPEIELNSSYEKTRVDDNRTIWDSKLGKWFETTGDNILVDGGGNPIGDFNQVDGALIAPYDAWIPYSATLTILNNRLRITPSPSVDGGVSTGFTTIPGIEYVFEGLADHLIVGSSSVRVGTRLKASDIAVKAYTGYFRIIFTARTTKTYITLNAGGGTTNPVEYDQIRVYQKDSTIGNVLTNQPSIIGDIRYLGGIPQVIVNPFKNINVMDDLTVKSLNILRADEFSDFIDIGNGEKEGPDGSIYGENVYGEYRKYPNGELVCKFKDRTPYVAASVTGTNYYVNSSVIFPHPFIERPTVLPYTHRDVPAPSGLGAIQIAQGGFSNILFAFYTICGLSGARIGIGYVAYGYWK